MAVGSPKASAWEPMRDAQGQVLTWPEEHIFALCLPADEGALSVAMWLGASTWWSDGALARTMTWQAPCTPRLDAGDGVTGLVSAWEPGDWPADFGPSDLVAAITVHTYVAATGRLLDADIYLNRGGFLFSAGGAAPGSLDAAAVVAHEMGHVLALGHPCGDPGSQWPSCSALPATEGELLGALLFPRTVVGARDYRPQGDDLAGLRARYGPGGPLPEVRLSQANGLLSVESAAVDGEWTRFALGEALVWVELGQAQPALAAETWLWAVRWPDGASQLFAGGVAAEDLESEAGAELVSGAAEGAGCGCALTRLPARGGLWALAWMALAALVWGWRRGRGVALLVLVVLGALCGSVGPAVAWERSQTCGGMRLQCAPGEVALPVWWATDCVVVHLHEAGSEQFRLSEIERVLRASLGTWNDVDCSYMTLVYGGLTNEDRVGYNPYSRDNANVVVFRDQGWTHSLGILGLTSVTMNRETGEIYDVDMEFNTEHYRFSMNASALTTVDLQNTMVHELGHVLGLDHSDVADATMYASAPMGETKKRTLHADDIEGLCAIFPLAARAEVGLCNRQRIGYYWRSELALSARPVEGCQARSLRGGPGSGAWWWCALLLVWGLRSAGRRRLGASRWRV